MKYLLASVLLMPMLALAETKYCVETRTDELAFYEADIMSVEEAVDWLEQAEKTQRSMISQSYGRMLGQQMEGEVVDLEYLLSNPEFYNTYYALNTAKALMLKQQLQIAELAYQLESTDSRQQEFEQAKQMFCEFIFSSVTRD